MTASASWAKRHAVAPPESKGKGFTGGAVPAICSVFKQADSHPVQGSTSVGVRCQTRCGGNAWPTRARDPWQARRSVRQRETAGGNVPAEGRRPESRTETRARSPPHAGRERPGDAAHLRADPRVQARRRESEGSGLTWPPPPWCTCRRRPRSTHRQRRWIPRVDGRCHRRSGSM